MPQLMRGVADDPIGVGGGVPLGELEVPASHGIAEVTAPVAVDQAAVQAAVAALAGLACCVRARSKKQ